MDAGLARACSLSVFRLPKDMASMEKPPFNSWKQQTMFPVCWEGGGVGGVRRLFLKKPFSLELPKIKKILKTKCPLCPHGDWRHQAVGLQESS